MASPEGQPPVRTLGFHSVTVVGRYVYILGGAPLDSLHTIRTYVFDLKLKEWRARVMHHGPSERYGHTTTLVDDKLMLFGGYITAEVFTNDLHIYDIPLDRWTQLNPPCPLPPVLFVPTAHYAEQVRKMFIVCGVIVGGRTYSKDVFAINPDEQKWIKCKAKGKSPGRGFHASCLSNSKIYLIGGVSEDGELGGNVVHVFDFSRGLHACGWSEIRIQGMAARSSIGSSLVYFHGGRILHLGGKAFVSRQTQAKNFLHWYDLNSKKVSLVPHCDTDTAETVTCSGFRPTERRNFGLIHLNDKLMIIGGYKLPASEVYELDISSLT